MMSHDVTIKHKEGVMMICKNSAYIDVSTFFNNAYAGTVRVPKDTKYLNLVTGWELPIVEVSHSPQRFSVFLEPRHNKRHPSMW